LDYGERESEVFSSTAQLSFSEIGRKEEGHVLHANCWGAFFGILEREKARLSPYGTVFPILVMWEEVDVRKDGERQDSIRFYICFLVALCRDVHTRNGVLFEVDAASNMRIGTLCFYFFVRRGPLAHITRIRRCLGPAFMSFAALRFADEAIEDILKLGGSKGHSHAFLRVL